MPLILHSSEHICEQIKKGINSNINFVQRADDRLKEIIVDLTIDDLVMDTNLMHELKTLLLSKQRYMEKLSVYSTLDLKAQTDDSTPF